MLPVPRPAGAAGGGAGRARGAGRGVRGGGRLTRAPDSAVAREAEQLAAEVSPPFLAHHSQRSYWWGVALAERDRVRYDAELLYVAALLHDIGLTPRFEGPGCFEDEGAAAAARFAADRGWSAERCDALAEAIRLHMAVEVELADGPEAYLLYWATSVDVSGARLEELPRPTIDAVLARHPRDGFAAGFVELFREQAARKPGCRAAALMTGGLEQRIAAAPFPRSV